MTAGICGFVQVNKNKEWRSTPGLSIRTITLLLLKGQKNYACPHHFTKDDINSQLLNIKSHLRWLRLLHCENYFTHGCDCEVKQAPISSGLCL